MFGGSGRNGFALGLVVGICLTLLFCIYSWWGLHSVISTNEDTLAQWLMAVFSLVATGVSAWAVVLLGQTLRQTEIATQSTQEAIGITARMGRLQTQAYLTFSGSETAYFPLDGPAQGFQIRPRFKNTGQSPGMIVYAFCHIKFVDDLSAPIEYVVQRFDEYRTKLHLGPGEERWIGGPTLKVDDAVQAIANRKTILFLGCIEYTDTFDDVRRSEDFCFAIDFHGDPAARCGHSWLSHRDYKVRVI